MTIWGINFWMLFSILLIAAVVIFIWGLNMLKKVKKEGLAFLMVLPGIGITFPTVSTFFAVPLLIGFYFGSLQGNINAEFRVWGELLGIAFLSLIVSQLALTIKRSRNKDKPNKANIGLKKLQKSQQKEVKELTTK